MTEQWCVNTNNFTFYTKCLAHNKRERYHCFAMRRLNLGRRMCEFAHHLAKYYKYLKTHIILVEIYPNSLKMSSLPSVEHMDSQGFVYKSGETKLIDSVHTQPRDIIRKLNGFVVSIQHLCIIFYNCWLSKWSAFNKCCFCIWYMYLTINTNFLVFFLHRRGFATALHVRISSVILNY